MGVAFGSFCHLSGWSYKNILLAASASAANFDNSSSVPRTHMVQREPTLRCCRLASLQTLVCVGQTWNNKNFKHLLHLTVCVHAGGQLWELLLCHVGSRGLNSGHRVGRGCWASSLSHKNCFSSPSCSPTTKGSYRSKKRHCDENIPIHGCLLTHWPMAWLPGTLLLCGSFLSSTPRPFELYGPPQPPGTPAAGGTAALWVYSSGVQCLRCPDSAAG